jgi:hypothetical protein
VLRFPQIGMVLLKKHSGGIFTSIRAGRKVAIGPGQRPRTGFI